MEICLKATSKMDHKKVRVMVKEFLLNNCVNYEEFPEIEKILKESSQLGNMIERAKLYGDIEKEQKYEEVIKEQLAIHIYQLNDEDPSFEMTEGGGTEGEESSVAFNQVVLPSATLEDLWDSLIYDSNIKENLLSYIETSFLLSEKNVNPTLISWNRVVLLHGPPGTGKKYFI